MNISEKITIGYLDATNDEHTPDQVIGPNVSYAGCRPVH
jgi:hypothetical protein